MFEKKLIKKPIRIIELFGGYGSQYMALKYLGANVESYKLVEWEVAAIEAYTRFHHEYKHFECDDLTSELYNLGISNDGKVPMTLQQIERRSDEWKQKVYNNIRSSNNLVNILTTKGKDLEIVEKDKYEYIMTYSFPCQDLSLAGKGAGLGEGTRSGLLWQVERILLELKDLNELPQILLMENVPMILSPKYRDDFAKWDLALSKLGYKSYVKNLIATDYSIPQIRNRTFMISILGEYSYAFPNKLKKEYILKDFLENNVDESYYLSNKQISDINNWKAYQKPFETMKQIEKTGNSPTLTTRGDTLGVVVREEYQGMYQYSKSDKFMNGKDRFTKNKELADTILTTPQEGVVVKNEINGSESLRIRKLTPKECFRLMGVKDRDYDKIADFSNSSLYKLAGNSIVIQVLMGIFGELLGIDYKKKIKESVKEIV